MATEACSCAAYEAAMPDGHPNPESAQEWKEAHGHYPNCPAQPRCYDEHGGTGSVCRKSLLLSGQHSGQHSNGWLSW